MEDVAVRWAAGARPIAVPPDRVTMDERMFGYNLPMTDPSQQKLPEIDPTLEGSNLEKDPDDWTTGDEPMTGAQASYLKTLSDQAGEPFSTDLTKAEASKRIDELQDSTGRGT